MDSSSIIGLVGTAVTIVAFGITIFQLNRTAKATRAVDMAMAKLRNRMSTFDIASESLKASKALQHAVTFLRLKRWGDAAAAIWEAQISMNRIERFGPNMTEDKRDFGADFLITVVSDLEDASDKGIDYEAKGVILSLRKQINQLESDHLSQTQELIDV